jgi:DNA-binding winged helix-turn-helix (wHTH) protein
MQLALRAGNMTLGESEHGEKALRIGLLCDPECPLPSQALERAGTWTCDVVRMGAEPLSEPPDWDALLMDASTGLSPRQAAAHFGISAPVIAVVRSSADALDRSTEHDGAHALLEVSASSAQVLLTVRIAVNAHREAHRVSAGQVLVDLLQNTLHVGKLSVSLTAGEASVVGCLARTAGRWWSSKELLRELGTVHETSSPVWQHVGRVRTKLGKLETIIESNQALGYRLNPCAVHAQRRRSCPARMNPSGHATEPSSRVDAHEIGRAARRWSRSTRVR